MSDLGLVNDSGENSACVFTYGPFLCLVRRKEERGPDNKGICAFLSRVAAFTSFYIPLDETSLYGHSQLQGKPGSRVCSWVDMSIVTTWEIC